MYLQHRDTGNRQAIPADYIEAGHVVVDYASTIHRAQGAIVDEAHLIVSEHIDANQLYVGAARGRTSNHITSTRQGSTMTTTARVSRTPSGPQGTP